MKGKKKKSAPTFSELSQEAHLAYSEYHTLSWGGTPGGQEGADLSSPKRTSGGSHLLKIHNSSRKHPPHQGCKEPSPRSWVRREEKQAGQDWAPGRAPDERGDRDLEVLPRETCERHTLGTAALGRPREVTALQLLWTQGYPQEAQEPDSSPETCTHSCSWNRLKRPPDTVQDSASLLGSVCAPQPTDAPSVPLDPFHSPWGKGCPCWAE